MKRIKEPPFYLPLPCNWDVATAVPPYSSLADQHTQIGRNFQSWGGETHCWQWLIRMPSGMPTFVPLGKDFYTTEISRKVDFSMRILFSEFQV